MGLVAPGMWDLPRSGIEPVSFALAGKFFFFFLTTTPPGNVLIKIGSLDTDIQGEQCEEPHGDMARWLE